MVNGSNPPRACGVPENIFIWRVSCEITMCPHLNKKITGWVGSLLGQRAESCNELWQEDLGSLNSDSHHTRLQPVPDRLSASLHLSQDDLTKSHPGESSKVLSDRRGFWGQFCASYHTFPVWTPRLLSREFSFLIFSIFCFSSGKRWKYS